MCLHSLPCACCLRKQHESWNGKSLHLKLGDQSKSLQGWMCSQHVCVYGTQKTWQNKSYDRSLCVHVPGSCRSLRLTFTWWLCLRENEGSWQRLCSRCHDPIKMMNSKNQSSSPPSHAGPIYEDDEGKLVSSCSEEMRLTQKDEH